jgi:hypothetical protein
MIADGNYRAKALDGEFANSKNKGTPFVRVRFQFQTPEGTEVLGYDGYFTEATTERTIESLRHCGCTFPGDDLTNLEGLGSKDVEIVVGHEEANDGSGRMFPRIKWVNALGQGGKVRDEDKMDQGARTAFAKSMKGHLVAARMGSKKAGPAPKAAPKNGAKPTAPNPIDGGNDNDADISFP